MPWPDFLTFFSRYSHEKTGEISHFSLTPIGGENEKKSLTISALLRVAHRVSDVARPPAACNVETTHFACKSTPQTSRRIATKQRSKLCIAFEGLSPSDVPAACCYLVATKTPSRVIYGTKNGILADVLKLQPDLQP